MPPEVIFILVLVFFSLLENVLRGRKRMGGGEMPPGAGLPPRGPDGEDPRRAPGTREGPTSVAVPDAAEAPRRTAEGMVPDDIWEEIAALARGDVEETLRRRRERGRVGAPGSPGRPRQSAPQAPPRRPLPVPRERPEPEPVGASTPARSRAPRPDVADERTEEGAVSRWGEGLRRTLEGDIVQEAPVGRPRPAPTVKREVTPAARTQATGDGPRTARGDGLRPAFRGARALRHAVIAQEVLGRPLALREYGEDTLWSL